MALQTQEKASLSDVFGQGLATVKANPLASLGVAGGATLGSAMANRDDDDDDKKSDYKRTETVPVKDDIRFPVIGYRPGHRSRVQLWIYKSKRRSATNESYSRGRA